MSDWLDLNPDPVHVKREREKARELRKTDWWKAQLAKGECYYCRKVVGAANLTLDHVVPVARGGKSTRGNCVPACRDCNAKKKAYTPAEQILDKLFESCVLAVALFAAGVLQAEPIIHEDELLRILNLRGAGTSESYEKAGEVVKTDAETGEPFAKFVLALVSEFDDPPAAAKLAADVRTNYLASARADVLERAETRNDPLAWYVLSVEKNDMKLLERAADGGNVQAINAYASLRLATALEEKRKGGTNDVTAVMEDAYARFHRASVGGDANALCNLGLCLVNGYGCTNDPVRAYHCFRMSANRGHAEAMDHLSYCYDNGVGVAADAGKALEWKIRARAAVGDAHAMDWLKANGKDHLPK